MRRLGVGGAEHQMGRRGRVATVRPVEMDLDAECFLFREKRDCG